MKKTVQTISALWVVALMTMTACTDDWDVVGSRPSDVICFTATLGDHIVSGSSRSTSGHLAIEEEEWQLEGMPTEGHMDSRGGLTTSLTGQAGVIGITANDGVLPYSFNGDELTSSGSPVYWKDMTKADFDIYAYAPHDVATVNAANKTITFQVDDEVSNQKDVIVATRSIVYDSDKTKSDFNKTVPLAFKHILTAVRFKLAIDGAALQSIIVSGVKNKGVYTMTNGGSWSGHETVLAQGKTETSYTITSTDAGNELLMIPQELTESAKVTLKYKVGDTEKTLEADLVGEWQPGKLITYTLYEGSAPEYIYFDLAAGNVLIGCTENEKNEPTETNEYIGYVFNNGEKTCVTGTHDESNIYYVYQTEENNPGTSTLPNYTSITYNGKPWVDFIKNNTSVAGVIKAWKEATSAVGRTATENRIRVYGSNKVVNLTIDNIYSTYAERSMSRTTAGIGFNAGSDSKLTITAVGDNRVCAIHYHGGQDKNNELILEGTGSLTVAAASGKTTFYNKSYVGETAENDTTFIDNHWCSAIGGNDSGEGNSCGIVINSGNIFAGTTKAENCTAIGAGGNDKGIITINGGTITAVATTTGTAIGGGIGFNSSGGVGVVTLNNGNVYAYNHANRWDIPSSAIGGAGSYKSVGTIGTVTIEDGYVYAYSALGTAIGGGSSRTEKGGTGNVTINGGMVIAKTGSRKSASIGGGTGNSGARIYYEDDGDELRNDIVSRNGGDAEVTINGGVVRTGSIGGGGTGMENDIIGNATVTITGGDIQAQCILAAGSGKTPSFKMSGGVLRNCNVIYTPDADYLYVKEEGGAVYLEDGTCIIEGTAKISNCTAKEGGAVYIKGTYDGVKNKYTASFNMNGGTIEECMSEGDGGAVCLLGGDVTITGGTIQNNLAQGGNGGGICINEGNFAMSAVQNVGKPEIKYNASIYQNGKGGNGGALYVSTTNKPVSVSVEDGVITSNTSDRKGGAICVVMPEGAPADIQIGLDNGTTGTPTINGNYSLQEGGGLYANGSGLNITIYSGTILGNGTSAYVSNTDIANEGGLVQLEGECKEGEGQKVKVDYVTVTFNGNGGKLDGQSGIKRNIVRATNGLLNAPSFNNPGYTIKCWNTRKDGKGDKTFTSTINVDSDITIYAQWE